MLLPSSVQIVETGPGEGFPREKLHLPTPVKVEIVRRVLEAGVPEVVAARFAEAEEPSPKLADAAAVLERVLAEEPDARGVLSARVSGARGARRALESGAARLLVAVPATDGWGRRYEGDDRGEALRALAEVAGVAKEAGASVVVTVPAAFGCPIEGPGSPDDVADLVLSIAGDPAFGPPARITLSDAPGLATPVGVEGLVESVLRPVARQGSAEWLAVRLSDTRGLGLANALAALQSGVRTLEGAVAGVGGSLVEPGAPGPVATEDLVYLCGELGIDTGVDFRTLRRAARRTVEAAARPLPSRTVNIDPRASVYARIG